MSGLVTQARAKLNLSLDVLGRRGDGYHELRMVMQEAELSDEVYVELREPGFFRAETNRSYIPTDERNVAVKAARAFFELAGLESGAYIMITKRIPVCAGLGGGSADAAAVIRALSELTGRPLDEAGLYRAAERAGSDVPFCLMGGTALAEGRGERLTPLPELPELPVVICMPYFTCSTPELFTRLDSLRTRCRPDTAGLVAALGSGDVAGVARRMYNVFEDALERRPAQAVGEIKRLLLEHGALGAVMSGSGSAVYGLFTDEAAAERAAQAAGRSCREVFLSRTARAGRD